MIHRNSLLQVVALAITIASCAQENQLPHVTIAASVGSSSTSRSMAGELFQEVNHYRLQKGRQPLRRHGGLDKIAENHANYLIANRGTFSLHGRYVSHHGFEGRSAYARQRYGFHNISENIAATTGGPRNAPRVFCNIWVKSRAHEINLSSSWNNTGVGVAMADDGTVVAVQLFGAISSMGSHDAMMEKFRGF